MKTRMSKDWGLLAVLAVVALPAHALDAVSYGEAVVGPRRNAAQIEALGPDLFGESINSFTGGLVFYQTDIDLPGNSALPVRLSRRLLLDGNKSPAFPAQETLWAGHAFGEWELDIPYLGGIYAETDGWVVSTATPQARCSSPSSAAQFRPRDTSVGDVYFPSNQFWSGIKLSLPGQGEAGLVHYASDDPLPHPAGTGWTRLKTPSNWHFSCLPSLKSGQPGEGFVGLSPDGVRYYFDWMVSRPERMMHGRSTIVLRNGGTFTQSADLMRQSIRIYPSRIEDRFGNWINYVWSENSLQSIVASDGRTISLTYSIGKVASATDGTGTSTYAYSNGLLASVTRPDGSFWAYDTASVVAIPRYVPLSDPDPFDQLGECQLMRRLTGNEADLRITHPSGAVGVYRLAFKRLFRTGLAGSESSCAFYDPGREDGPTTFWDFMPREPTRFDVLGVKSKQVSGPGVSTGTWTFEHQDTYVMSTYPKQGTRSVTSVRPDGSVSVDVFGTDATVNEGQLISSEIKDGATTVSRTDAVYVSAAEVSAMPFPDWAGEPLEYQFIRGPGDFNRPRKTTTETRGGVQFKSEVQAFDVFARPVKIKKASQALP